MRMILANSYDSSGGGSLPSQITYTTGSGLVTAPSGATNVIIAVWGGGAGGRLGYVDESIPEDGAGGGAGGYSQTSVAITAGQTLNYSVGAGGASNSAGGNSSCSSGSKSITTMTANGAPSNSGGTASGGTTTNTTGASGGAPDGAFATSGWNSNSAGAGGNGGFGKGGLQAGQPGSAGKVIFYFT